MLSEGLGALFWKGSVILEGVIALLRKGSVLLEGLTSLKYYCYGLCLF